MTKVVVNKNVLKFNPNPTRDEAMQAVKTLIAWAGDNPGREGLIDTPRRVVDAYREFFSGYEMNPEEILSTTFEEVEGYDEIIIIKDIRLESHCEHHIVPILGKAHQLYARVFRAIAIIDSVFSMYGFNLNYKKGKWEALFFGGTWGCPG